ncbi:helix-turn-helix domain-containing protein [Actinoplanes sp. TBRC 11911]|uniref:helix-turn-helix domain-containing protein n=1 Tax=Actinoplanes sp. TBRC 11911 TaxID=2729386 RepID=UPI00145CC1FA|nr:helix-turn-helix domain-containing protein [Actinoplanes sp. TBRC 11911]NMO53449.1 helix-turn-helix domain-containing protein [Actinoplanes sp. TBRC 11911]
MPKRVWTIDEVRRLGLATDVETAASVLRIGRTRAYGMVKKGTFPVNVLRIGKSYVVPVEGLLTLLDVAVSEAGE